MVTEKLLQFIWKNRYFSQHALRVSSGEQLAVEYPGDENTHQGPDFKNARIRIADNCWIGSVELHVFSSGWNKHHHSGDENYRNVILHVVWKQDEQLAESSIPQLELSGRISTFMLNTYATWMHKPVFIPCEDSAAKIDIKVWEDWAERLVITRLNRKMYRILGSLRENRYHWEEQLWWLIAANFGGRVNAAAFEWIARSIPYKLLAKHRQHFVQLEAMLLGQAGLLQQHFADAYPAMLQREYHYLKKKYNLKNSYGSVHFLRMRPDNFPNIRLSQLAAFCGGSTAFFSYVLNCNSLTDLREKFVVRANDYWNTHYIIDRPSPFREKILGAASRDSILLNAVIPLLYTYGKTIPDSATLNKAIHWLAQIPVENNQVIQNWKRIGIGVRKAPGSQALLELKSSYCDQHRCLDCEIGKRLLQPAACG